MKPKRLEALVSTSIPCFLAINRNSFQKTEISALD
jgi:hypothetical protein